MNFKEQKGSKQLDISLTVFFIYEMLKDLGKRFSLVYIPEARAFLTVIPKSRVSYPSFHSKKTENIRKIHYRKFSKL